MPRPATFHELHDAEWLRARYVNEGLQQSEIATLIGCSAGAVGRALKRYGITVRDRNEPEPSRAFAPLASRLAHARGDHALTDLEADVAADELARRLAEGLTDLAELARLAGEMPRDRLWSLVVEVDAPTARACVFAAAAVAAEQAPGGLGALAPSRSAKTGAPAGLMP
jgi:predicted transcriptional regulator